MHVPEKVESFFPHFPGVSSVFLRRRSFAMEPCLQPTGQAMVCLTLI